MLYYVCGLHSLPLLRASCQSKMRKVFILKGNQLIVTGYSYRTHVTIIHSHSISPLKVSWFSILLLNCVQHLQQRHRLTDSSWQKGAGIRAQRVGMIVVGNQPIP